MGFFFEKQVLPNTSAQVLPNILPEEHAVEIQKYLDRQFNMHLPNIPIPPEFSKALAKTLAPVINSSPQAQVNTVYSKLNVRNLILVSTLITIFLVLGCLPIRDLPDAFRNTMFSFAKTLFTIAIGLFGFESTTK